MEYYDGDFDGGSIYCSVCGLAIAEPSAICGIDYDVFCDSCVIDVNEYYNTVITPVLDEVIKLKKVD